MKTIAMSKLRKMELFCQCGGGFQEEEDKRKRIKTG